jgi:predicted unusual protein kinase regulating ubiquinone biosynthesis (AarF/ABC1/UbiB family)
VSAFSQNYQNSLPDSSDDGNPEPVANLEAAKKSYRWNQKNYSRNRRRFDIWVFVFTLLFQFWRNGKKWTYAGGYSEEKLAARRQRQAVWIRETLLELGPTFIKVGQLFSTRADLFPAEYVSELSKLQDKVPAFSYEQAAEIIEAGFERSIAKLYAISIRLPSPPPVWDRYTKQSYIVEKK